MEKRINKRKVNLPRSKTLLTEFSAVHMALSFLFLLLSFIAAASFISAVAGCCFDPKDGSCMRQAEKSGCESLGGDWSPNPSCGIQECEKGCCALGIETKITNFKECEFLSSSFGIPANFIAGMSENNCTLLSRERQRGAGACVSGNSAPYTCTFTTEDLCYNASSNFHLGVLCSDPSLHTSCRQTSNTMCWPPGNSTADLYFMDSCGNRDAKKQECGSGTGKQCRKLEAGKAVCKDTNCYRRINATANQTFRTGWSECSIASTELYGVCRGATVPSLLARSLTGDGYFLVGDYDLWTYTLNNGDTLKFRAPMTRDILGMTRECGQGGGPWGGTIDGCAGVNEWRKPQNGVDLEHGPALCENYHSDPVVRYFSECFTYELGLAGSARGYEVPEYASGYQTAVDRGITKNIGGPYNAPGAEFGKEINVSSLTVQTNPDTELRPDYVYPDAVGSRYYVTYCDDGEFKVNECADYRGEYCNAGKCVKNNGVNCADRSIENCATDDACVVLYDRTDPETVNCQTPLEATANAGNAAYDAPSNTNNPVCASKHATPGSKFWEADACDFSACYSNTAIALGDCGKKMNFDGKYGEMTNPSCSPWIPPATGACELCNRGKLPCSEYRCKAIGRRCIYNPDTGHCTSSEDTTGPTIQFLSMSPSNSGPLLPFTPIRLNLTTNEISRCRFSINSANTSLYSMKYEFGRNWSKVHSVKLTFPGTVPEFVLDSLSVPILSRDGNYDLKVRCEDEVGNAGTVESIVFTIFPQVDITPPILSNFNPPSESSVKFSSTEQKIKFQLDQPAECRWDFSEQDYSEMKHKFNCTNSITAEGIQNLKNGYTCSGKLTDVTTIIGEKTNFYIKCKDQPWLSSDIVQIGDVEYKRNTNNPSVIYTLGPSEELKIIDVSPGGSKILGAENISVQITAMTSGGAHLGISECYWRIGKEPSFTSIFQIFNSTYTNLHKQIITTPYAGDTYVQIRCVDSAGNTAYENATFNLIVDNQPPAVIASLKENQKISITTDEDAVCYYSLDESKKCSYELETAKMMTGFEKEHTAEIISNRTYYIKCEDFFGNSNLETCAKTIKT